MKVLVVGANGQIGSQVVDLLKESKDYMPIALVRKKEQVKSFEDKGIETRLGNLEDSVADLQKAISGCETVIFSAGSGGSTGPDKTLMIDLDGAGKMIEAAINEGIGHFVMVSAQQSHNRENWSEQMKPYYVAKHYADRLLVESGLTYTILRPGLLKNESGSGKIQADENLERGPIPREDVAKSILMVLGEEAARNKSFDLTTGDIEIEEAIKNL